VLSDRPDRQGLRAAVERAGLVSRWFGVLLDLRPRNLPAWQVDGDGKDDPGAGYVVIMPFGAVECAGPTPKDLALTGGTGINRSIGGDGTLVEFGNGKGKLTHAAGMP
jgi:hypothetical protein